MIFYPGLESHRWEKSQRRKNLKGRKMNDIIGVKSQNYPWAWPGSASRNLQDQDWITGKAEKLNHIIIIFCVEECSGGRAYSRILLSYLIHAKYIYLFKLLGTKCLSLETCSSIRTHTGSRWNHVSAHFYYNEDRGQWLIITTASYRH